MGEGGGGIHFNKWYSVNFCQIPFISFYTRSSSFFFFVLFCQSHRSNFHLFHFMQMLNIMCSFLFTSSYFRNFAHSLFTFFISSSCWCCVCIAFCLHIHRSYISCDIFECNLFAVIAYTTQERKKDLHNQK